MLIAQIIELAPDKAQIDAFYRNASGARISRNDLIIMWREEGKRLPGFRMSNNELWRAFTAVKYDAHPWFRDISTLAVRGGMRDALDAIKRYYSGQARRPKLHGKYGKRRGFRIDNGVGTVAIDGLRLALPSKAGGSVRMKHALRWPKKKIRQCRIFEKAGRWFASVLVDIDKAEYPHRAGEGPVGIDLGLKTFATIAWADDRIEKVDAPEPFKRSLKSLRRAQRRVSRRKLGGRNRAKAQIAVNKRHFRMANHRKDFLHKLSHQLTANAEIVKVENLSIKGWQKLWGRKTSDLAPASLLRQLKYKAEWRDGAFKECPWNFPSSQLCHDCGYKHSELTLSMREWTCPACGVLHDRDANAARNIRDYSFPAGSGGVHAL